MSELVAWLYVVLWGVVYIAQGRLAGYRVGPRLLKVDLDGVDRLARPIPTARRPG